MIVAEGLTKRYGTATVVDQLSFEVQPGRVTGFLGPNGAGKTQTIKMILGLVQASSGQALIDGRPLAAHANPPAVVGTVLDGGAFHPSRSARDALRIHAQVAGVPARRVDETLERVGLSDALDKKVGTFSLGMRQRLALAQGLITDPPLLIADEPANGLDPAGITWMRDLLRELAAEGKAIFVSSHLLTEMERMVDDVLVIAQGRLITQGTLADLRGSGAGQVRVGAADPALLTEHLLRHRLVVSTDADGLLAVDGGDAQAIGAIAHAADIPLHHLAQAQESLEDRYLELTAGLGRGL